MVWKILNSLGNHWKSTFWQLAEGQPGIYLNLNSPIQPHRTNDLYPHQIWQGYPVQRALTPVGFFLVENGARNAEPSVRRKYEHFGHDFTGEGLLGPKRRGQTVIPTVYLADTWGL